MLIRNMTPSDKELSRSDRVSSAMGFFRLSSDILFNLRIVLPHQCFWWGKLGSLTCALMIHFSAPLIQLRSFWEAKILSQRAGWKIQEGWNKCCVFASSAGPSFTVSSRNKGNSYHRWGTIITIIKLLLWQVWIVEWKVLLHYLLYLHFVSFA